MTLHAPELRQALRRLCLAADLVVINGPPVLAGAASSASPTLPTWCSIARPTRRVRRVPSPAPLQSSCDPCVTKLLGWVLEHHRHHIAIAPRGPAARDLIRVPPQVTVRTRSRSAPFGGQDPGHRFEDQRLGPLRTDRKEVIAMTTQLEAPVTSQRAEAGPDTCRLYLVRHGTTTLNVENRYRGRRDVPLDAQGYQDAVDAARRLSRVGLTASIPARYGARSRRHRSSPTKPGCPTFASCLVSTTSTTGSGKA